MANIVAIHGFRDRSAGALNVDRLDHGLRYRGHAMDTDNADYGFHWFIKVRIGLFHRDAIARIAAALADADVIVAHSNGRNYGELAIALAAEAQPEKSWHFFSLSGARDNDAPIHPSISRLDVFHSHHDRTVKLARWLPGHRWGDEGAVGYQGEDPRVYNHDYTHRVIGHSDWFNSINRDFFAGQISELINRRTA